MKTGNRTVRTKKKGYSKRYLPLTLMALPAVIYLFVNNYMPLAGLVLAFKKINFTDGIWKSPWCGWNNFKFLFSSPDASRITVHTIGYNLIFIVTGLVGGVLTAILLSELGQSAWQKFYQASFIIPYLVSMKVVGYVVYAFLDPRLGILNKVCENFGVKPMEWYATPKPWPYILVFVQFWKNTGYGAILYLASIAGIDQSLYEAADLDGASRWQRIRYVTLPMLIPLMTTLTLLNVGKIFYSDFGLFYQVPMASGLLQKTTEVIDTYVYRMLLISGDIGRSAAAGFYQSIVGAVLVVASNLIVRRISPDDALF